MKNDLLANIQRYEDREDVGMIPTSDGDYVSYGDVVKLVISMQEKIDAAYQRGWEDGLNED